MNSADKKQELSEARMVHLVRNALLVAGKEMGDDGDHWPVIKATIRSIMKDWEEAKIERNVSAELKKYYVETIAVLKTMHDQSPLEMKPSIDKALKELDDLYTANFTEVSPAQIFANDIPVHLKRAKAIIDTLGGEDE